MSSTSAFIPLRVCHLAYSFYDYDGRVTRYAEFLAGRGHHVDVITLRGPAFSWKENIRGVRVYRIQRRTQENHTWQYLAKMLWFFIKSTLLLTGLQVRRRYDVVHVHNVPDFLVFAAILPKMMGSRIILDIHDIMPEFYLSKSGLTRDTRLFQLLLLVERLSCRFSDHVIVANHLWHDRLVSRSVPLRMCTALLNYPDLNLFSQLPEAEKRRDGKFIFLYPGTLNQHQGLDVAIKAFARVHTQMLGAEFHIYGGGPSLAELKNLTQQCGITNVVKFRASLPLQKIAPVIASADAGVVPKRAEGFGNEAFSTKILEFMACGVPVVVSRTRVDAHYFDDTLVRFFASGDEDDLASALLWVYQHRYSHDAWVQRARNFAVRNSWQERATDYLELPRVAG